MQVVQPVIEQAKQPNIIKVSNANNTISVEE
jgi:hypothetical protein